MHGTHQLAYVAHLVIVPAYGTYQLRIANGLYTGLCTIKQATVADADDVAADNFVFGVAKALIGSGLHSSIYFFYSGFFA